jgi:cold shock CspA family protein
LTRWTTTSPAFAAERQLTEFKRQISGEIKPHEAVFAAQVSELHPAKDYGLILTHEGAQLYFHRNSLIGGDFDKLRVADRVHFTEADGDTGPIAYKLWPAAEAD